MIKTIEWQHPAKLTIIKDGEVVADFYIPGIKGGIDTDKIKLSTVDDPCDMKYHVRLEV